MSIPEPVAEFIERVRHASAEARIGIDQPRDASGEWMLDITSGGVKMSVAWRRAFGFGLFTSEYPGIGARPDEVYLKAEEACARWKQLRKCDRR